MLSQLGLREHMMTVLMVRVAQDVILQEERFAVVKKLWLF
jgi:hypothetical protein